MIQIKLLAAAAVGLMFAAPAFAETAGDAAAGATVFKKCAACHNIGEGATNKVGPSLENVVGRQAGTEEGFRYSPALVKAGEGGLHWTPADLAEWVKDPKAKVPGNRMAFAGLKDQTEIDNLIAYLIENSPDYVPPAQ